MKTVRFRNPVYVGDPINAVRIFSEKEVDELCLLDIDASRNGSSPNFDQIGEIVSEAFMPVSYGGGIKSLEDMIRLFRIGIEKVVLNSIVYTNPTLIVEAAKRFGEQAIILGVDVKKAWNGRYRFVSNGGKLDRGRFSMEVVERQLRLGFGEMFVNFVDDDGVRQGMNTNLIDLLSKTVSVPLVACGGVGSFEHIQDVIAKTNVSAIGAGSYCVFQGKHKAVLINYPDRAELDLLNSTN